ncbi:MAG TPA: DUF881 domain-containing protein [Armatimonadota bacterium]
MNTQNHVQDKASIVQRHWLWQVTALALFLGAILGASLRAQENFRKNNIFPNRNGVPQVEYNRQVKANTALQAEIKRLNEEKRKLTEGYSGGAKVATLKAELRDTMAFAALTPIVGPGVTITLNDVPPAKRKTMGLAVDESNIHDVDVFEVVNELRAAGAEAIVINGQRLSAVSPIRCVGNSVLINATPVGMPLRISAIGNRDGLYSSIMMNGGIMDPENSRLALLNMISITKEKEIRAPAYSGPTALRAGRPQ